MEKGELPRKECLTSPGKKKKKPYKQQHAGIDLHREQRAWEGLTLKSGKVNGISTIL